MKQDRTLRQRLAMLALCGLVLLSFPLMSLPRGEWLGVPALFVYVFFVWAGLIVVAALLIERKSP